MTKLTYDQDHWESLWSKTLREHADKVSSRPPSARLTDEVRGLGAGQALDAGCGHGAESLWLAAHGWRVTAVDFSTSALDHARSTAESAARQIAERIDWVHADLTGWAPNPSRYDLVVSLYVHVPGSWTTNRRPRCTAFTRAQSRHGLRPLGLRHGRPL